MPFVVIVLAMLAIAAVIALVASGRGAGLQTPVGAAAHDRAPTGPLALPVDGPVTAEDLERVRFSVVPRGYRPDEVEAVLDRLADELAEREDRIRELESARRPAPAAAPKAPSLAKPLADDTAGEPA